MNNNKITEIERNQVKRILLTNIVSSKNGIKLIDNKIFSSQKYKSGLDSDMSDFAIGFYEIIYKEILENKKILNENGIIRNNNFAGDTMNSFNTIANSVPEAGKSKDKRTPKEEWPEYLINFNKQYHCLANFWLLPMEIGRMSARGIKTEGGKSLNKCSKTKDYMDRYLKYIISKIDFSNPPAYKEYFTKFKDLEDFCNKHFLKSSYIKNNSFDIQVYSENKKTEGVIKSITNVIEIRANEIANSKYAFYLYEYFKRLNLL